MATTMVEPPAAETAKGTTNPKQTPGEAAASQPAHLTTNGHHGQQQPAPPIVCPGHVRPLAEVAFSGDTLDGVFLISACLDAQPMLRDGATGDWIGTFAGHKGAVWSAKLCKEARLAATGSGDFSAKLWDALTGQCLSTLQHGHVVKSVDFSDDRRFVATGGHEGVVRVWDCEADAAGGPTVVLGDQPKAANGSGSASKPPAVNKVLWLAPDLVGNDHTLAAGYGDGRVAIWDVRDPKKRVTTLKPPDGDDHKGPVMDLDVTNVYGVGVLTVASGASVKFWRVDASSNHWGEETAREAGPMLSPVHFREEGGAALSPDGSRVVLGGGRHGGSRQGALGVEKGATRVGDVGSDLTVFVMDFASGAVLDERKGHCGPVRCVRFHPSGGTVATGSEDGTIRLWDVSASSAAAAPTTTTSTVHSSSEATTTTTT